jgi:hypothetical protein
MNFFYFVGVKTKCAGVFFCVLHIYSLMLKQLMAFVGFELPARLGVRNAPSFSVLSTYPDPLPVVIFFVLLLASPFDILLTM